MAIAPRTPTGRLMRKIQCQLAYSTSTPPSAGPTSGPIWPGSVTNVIAAIYCSRGTIFITVRRPTGTSIAPPNPCSTRASTS